MNDDQMFALSAAEGRTFWARFALFGGWGALFALTIATGVHAIFLVESQLTATAGVMGVIRLISPVLTETVVMFTSIGFAAHTWRANQRYVGVGIEVLWLIFAALNLITAFNMEAGGATLPPALFYWLHYGLPISALAAGALFYIMLRVDPEHERQTEMKATAEAHKMAEFNARRSVLLSPQMASVLRQRGWLAVIAGLEREGYTQQQIQFMLSGVPELQALTAGQTPPASLPAPAPTQAAPARIRNEPLDFLDYASEIEQAAADMLDHPDDRTAAPAGDYKIRAAYNLALEIIREGNGSQLNDPTGLAATYNLTHAEARAVIARAMRDAHQAAPANGRGTANGHEGFLAGNGNGRNQ